MLVFYVGCYKERGGLAYLALGYMIVRTSLALFSVLVTSPMKETNGRLEASSIEGFV